MRRFNIRLVFAISITAVFGLSVLSRVSADDRAERVTTIAVPDRGQPVSAKTDYSGAIHLLINTGDGPRYAKSTDDGKTFSATMPVIVGRESLKVDDRLIFEAWDMAIGKDGRVHVAISSPNAWKIKVPQNQWGMYYARLDPAAKSFTPMRQINGRPSEGFSIAADDKGTVTACWLANKLYANVSKDNGKTFGAEVEVNPSYDPCNCCTTSSTYGTDGKLAVLYREETNNERDMYLMLADQGKKKMSRTRVSTVGWKIDSCPMTYYTIAPTLNGYVAAWPTGGNYDIYFARLDPQGKVLSPGEIKTPGKAGHRTGVTALSASDGSALVLWSKDKRLGWQLYDAQGLAVGRPGTAQTSGDGVCGVVDSKGNYLVFR